MSPEEKSECRRILHLLNKEDVFSLAGTTTNHLIKLDSRREAEDAILQFSESPRDFLNRRKISKEILVNYMYNVGIPVYRDCSKAQAVEEIISHWNKKCTQSLPQLPDTSHNQSASASRIVATTPVRETVIATVSSNRPSQPTFVQNVFNYNPAHITVNCNVDYTNNAPVQAVAGDASNQNKAEAFVKWFYEMLNNPHQNYGPQHFWDDVKLFLVMSTPMSNETETHGGSQLVAQRLVDFTQKDLVLFNPNVSSEGVIIKTNPHGLILIIACGTLHKNNNCMGIFQQSFGLLTDPRAPGSWKVKVTCLKMEQRTALALPRLGDFNDIQTIEQHTVHALEDAIKS